MGKPKSPRQLTNHHIFPSSRGGENGQNLIRLPRGFHESWHEVFGTLTLSEINKFLAIVFKGEKRRWTFKELNNLKIDLQIETLQRKKRNKSKEAK